MNTHMHVRIWIHVNKVFRVSESLLWVPPQMRQTGVTPKVNRETPRGGREEQPGVSTPNHLGLSPCAPLLMSVNAIWTYRASLKKVRFVEICTLSPCNVFKSDFIPKSSWNKVNRDFFVLKALHGRLLSRPFLAQIAENYPFGAKNCVFGPKVQFLETSSKKFSCAKLSTPKSPFLPNFNYFWGWNPFWTHYTVIRCRFWLNTLFSETPCSLKRLFVLKLHFCIICVLEINRFGFEFG